MAVENELDNKVPSKGEFNLKIHSGFTYDFTVPEDGDNSTMISLKPRLQGYIKCLERQL
jgi:hypothetical protein